MKKNLIILIILITLSACVQQDSNRGYIVKIGDEAPEFSLKLNNEKDFVLSQNKGKIIMLQFTASWCGVCRKEMPVIEKEIWQKLKTNENFVLIGIDKDEPLETVQEFAKQTGISYPLALDHESKVFEKYANKKAGVTRNVIINKEGKIVFLTRLYEEKEFNEMKKIIFNLLEE